LVCFNHLGLGLVCPRAADLTKASGLNQEGLGLMVMMIMGENNDFYSIVEHHMPHVQGHLYKMLHWLRRLST